MVSIYQLWFYYLLLVVTTTTTFIINIMIIMMMIIIILNRRRGSMRILFLVVNQRWLEKIISLQRLKRFVLWLRSFFNIKYCAVSSDWVVTVLSTWFWRLFIKLSWWRRRRIVWILPTSSVKTLFLNFNAVNDVTS